MYRSNLKYSSEHCWLKIEEENRGRVGISHYYQAQLHNIVFVELPMVDTIVIQNEPFGVIESSKAACDLYSPITGRVIEINHSLESDPSLINKDPYGQGWMILVNLENPNEIGSLLAADEYLSLIKQ